MTAPQRLPQPGRAHPQPPVYADVRRAWIGRPIRVAMPASPSATLRSMRPLLALLLLFGCRPPVPPPLAGGIHINEPDLGAYAGALTAAGLDSVQVTAYARQRAWDGAAVDLEKQDPQEVIFQLDAAQEAGLQAALVLRTYLEHGEPGNRHL